jgi:hypothetical protein
MAANVSASPSRSRTCANAPTPSSATSIVTTRSEQRTDTSKKVPDEWSIALFTISVTE